MNHLLRFICSKFEIFTYGFGYGCGSSSSEENGAAPAQALAPKQSNLKSK
jgi:hypothetical protein